MYPLGGGVPHKKKKGKLPNNIPHTHKNMIYPPSLKRKKGTPAQLCHAPDTQRGGESRRFQRHRDSRRGGQQFHRETWWWSVTSERKKYAQPLFLSKLLDGCTVKKKIDTAGGPTDGIMITLNHNHSIVCK